MLYLDEDMLNRLLAGRRMTLSRLAKECGISRQSVYDMLGNKPVFNSSFVRILEYLGVDYDQITQSRHNAVLHNMPVRIQKAVMALIQFCDAHQAGLVLFGSRARGKGGVQADWDFGIYAVRYLDPRAFSMLKLKLMDDAFPNRIDVVNLNVAPPWFLESIADDHIQIHGRLPFLQFAERKAA
jgi:AcrR family transcriptional regulator